MREVWRAIESESTPKGGCGEEIDLRTVKAAISYAAIVEAAVQCIIEYGYANTTICRIARESNLSRGAIVCHFSNRLGVVRGAIVHVHAKLIEAFRHVGGRQLPAGSSRIRYALTAHWAQFTHPHFYAFHELTVAARTDTDLAEILTPLRRKFYGEWHKIAVEQFFEWENNSDRFTVALQLTQNLLTGMAVNRLLGHLDDETADKLLAVLEHNLRSLTVTPLRVATL